MSVKKLEAERFWFCRCDLPGHDDKIDKVSGRSAVQAAERYIRHIISDNEEWESFGSPNKIIVDVSKTVKSKNIFRVEIYPLIEIIFDSFLAYQGKPIPIEEKNKG